MDKKTSTSDSTKLVCQRDAFSIPQDLHYLNCAFVGPLSHKTQTMGKECVLRQGLPWKWKSINFFEEADIIRNLVAQIINTRPEHIAIIPAMSYAVSIVIKNLKCTSQNNIVILGEQFPSNVYGWKTLQKQGVKLRVVNRPNNNTNNCDDGHGGQQWNEQILQAIDSNTAVVAVPNIHWSDGTVFDLLEIGQKARSVGAAFVLDLSQSLGSVPFDVKKIQPDVMFSAGYKHILGPYGLGYSYYGERFLNAVPLEDTWIARKGSEDFSKLVSYCDEYRYGAVRFDVGERSNPILLPMMIEALRDIVERNPQKIQEYCTLLTGDFLNTITSLGCKIEKDDFRSSHLIGIRLTKNIDLVKLKQLLEKNHVYISIRGDAMRISVNVYNNRGDLQALLDVLKTVIK